MSRSSVGQWDLVFVEDIGLTVQIQWLDEDNVVVPLDGYTAKLQVRPFPESASAGSALLTLSTATGGLTVVGGVDSYVQLEVTPASSPALPAAWARAKYDLLLTSATGVVTKLLEGNAIYELTVTEV